MRDPFISCCCWRPATVAWRPVQGGHFLPTAETWASDGFIIINDGVRQSSETRVIPAITRTESNFGFRSSREMRLKKRHDAQRAASRQSGSGKHGVTSRGTLLSRCISIRNATFIANLKKNDCAQCRDGHAPSE